MRNSFESTQTVPKSKDATAEQPQKLIKRQ